MGVCTNPDTKFPHLEIDADLDGLDNLDLHDYEGPPTNDTSAIVYTVSLRLAKDVVNGSLESTLRRFPAGGTPQLHYRPKQYVEQGPSFRERAQKRLLTDLEMVLKGTVPPNTSRTTAILV